MRDDEPGSNRRTPRSAKSTVAMPGRVEQERHESGRENDERACEANDRVDGLVLDDRELESVTDHSTHVNPAAART